MTGVYSLKDGVLGTLIGHEASALHYAIIILLWIAVHLALWWSILHQLLRIQLALMHLRTGKGSAGTLNANGSLDHFKPRTGIYHPLYQAEVAGGQGLTRPHPDYEIFRSHFGRPVEFNQLL